MYFYYIRFFHSSVYACLCVYVSMEGTFPLRHAQVLANKVNTRLLIRTIVRDFLLSAKSSFIMCQAKEAEGFRWKYRYNRSQEGYFRSGDEGESALSVSEGTLCIKHLQQLLLIVARAYAYKCCPARWFLVLNGRIECGKFAA